MKFKNIKKEAKKGKSPSNSRTIPASFKLSFTKFTPANLLKIYNSSLSIFIIMIYILAVAVVGVDLQKNLSLKQSVDTQRENLTKELNFWESFIAKHNDYRDAYLQASVLEYKLGDTSKAKIYAEKGLTLDPNSEDGRKIEKLLSK
ncbi:MAG: hypothetical protein Q7R51_02705 [bacterium]|nr:hypothetical protein [bacterium]